MPEGHLDHFLDTRARGNIPNIIRNDDGLYEGDLVHYFQVLFNHAKNLQNPYHNARHILHVTWLCYQACVYYLEKGTAEMTKRAIRNLLVSAIFHDFDHTGKKVPDSFNITRAVAGFEKHVVDCDKPQITSINILIRATEYPHTVRSDRLPLTGQILRDADLAQALDPASIQQVVLGLSAERGISVTESLKIQISFQHSLKFTTEWAKERFPNKVIDEKIKETQEFLQLLRSY